MRSTGYYSKQELIVSIHWLSIVSTDQLTVDRADWSRAIDRHVLEISRPRVDCVLAGYPKAFQSPHDKINKMACAPSEDSDQPGHPPNLIRVFAVRMKKHWVLSYPLSAQQRLIRLGGCPGWSESSLGAHAFSFGFVMSRLIKKKKKILSNLNEHNSD